MRKLLAVVVLSLFVGPAPAHASNGRVDIDVVSSPKPTLVTGGSALVRVTGTGQVTVRVGWRDVTKAFKIQADGSRLGLVDGLPLGSSVITASVRRGSPAAVRVVNHPVTGPVFSGPQQVPFFCETTAFGLAPATPPNCAAPPVVSYQYRTTRGTFAALPDPALTPPDATVTTVNGRTVPYVVRIERGTVDRAVYEIAALYDGQAPSPTRTHDAWNKRLVYTFGGGCNVGYHQGATTGGVLNDLFLSQGYAVATSSLNVLDNNCSYVISAEVAMMVKEHFVETYGPPAHTIGWGGSGGAIQQYDIADNYPGILDGIVPQISFPDAVTTGGTVGDCRLLNRYFTATPGYTDDQRKAVSGYGAWGSCVNWDLAFASRGNATEACPPAIPVQYLYNPTTNPGGIKCTTAEQLVTQLGRDPATGFARGYNDNVGVQYGLDALKAGRITAEQFVDINEKVGGYDVAGNVVAARTAADPLALTRSYRSGLVLAGTGGLAATPVIDLRAYTDAVNDIHTRFWSFTVRQRLVDAYGPSGAAGQAMLVTPLGTDRSGYALASMDAWLTAIAADRRHGDGRAKMLRNRPADLRDGCWTAAGERVAEPLRWKGTGTCDTLYPSFADTRIAAGAPLRNDVLKCQLKPLDLTGFTTEQKARLRAVFPTGVCDYSRPGVGHRGLAGVWQSY
ncbi:DUF6351 family protein [Virgisporangium aurantiacum]|uniref:DUF6351 domain-containing protein n=1 Tax=Virgisporangium aurantiacum TaxID=175570 RepID=A0A8J3Z2C3_9ACTN|nr:DUF6351 family protein [Virgisporangium aurantiacum]GIJ53931.1 hypothetical protein Vau01_014470 [Virgisporangium aurantiacum]